MGNAASGCCQTQGDTSDGPPPPWLVQSSSDELGAAIDRKFSLGRDGEAGGERRVDVGCQAGFVETFHHGGGTLLLHFGDAAAGEAPDELLDVGDANDAEGGFAEVLRGCVDLCYVICHEREWEVWRAARRIAGEGSLLLSGSQMKRAREQDTGADADNHLVLELDMVPQATVVGAGGCLSLRTSLPLAAVRAAYRVSDFRALDSSFATTLIRDASLAYGAPQAYGAHQPRGRDFAAQACTSGADGSSAAGGWATAHRGTADAQGPEVKPRIRFEEYAWLADDFDDLLSRRKASEHVRQARRLAEVTDNLARDSGDHASIGARGSSARGDALGSGGAATWGEGGSGGDRVGWGASAGEGLGREGFRGSSWKPPTSTYPDMTRRRTPH